MADFRMAAAADPIDPTAMLKSRTSSVELAIREAWQECLAPHFSEGLVLVANGGFGRRELFPHSDIDLLLLGGKVTIAPLQHSAISLFLQKLWDCGLRMSQSVRTIADCCELNEQNIELSVSLLDQRFLIGDERLYENFAVRLRKFLYSQRQNLASYICRLARARHAQHGDSIYELEPNIKESPGGLRDLQLIRWLSQLRNASPTRAGQPEERPELDSPRQFLFSLRCWLHGRAGRDSNLLTFDYQDEISPSPAGYMRQYFRHARTVHTIALREIDITGLQASSLLLQFRDWRSRVANAEFSVSRERVYFRAPLRDESDPMLVLRLFEFVARHGLRLAPDTERRVADYQNHMKRYFAEPRRAWPQLQTILSLPHAAAALRAMHDTGVLQALLPEWQKIDCLVIHDFYHRYTVDEHTLQAVQNIWLLNGTNDPARARFSEILTEIEDPAPLLFALLFHDIGKADGSPHIPASIRAAEAAMARLRVPEAVQKTIRRLIELHHDLSFVMNSRDLDEPSTAIFIAERVGTLEILKQLTLMTYADISAVNPGAMTPWRLEQLWCVYLTGYNQLTRALENRIGVDPHQSPEKAAFLDGFPVRYLRTHSEAEINAHLELERRARFRSFGIEIQKLKGTYKLTAIGPDRPFLLASLAGALSGFGMNILKAEGFANSHGVILDEFIFTDPMRTLELNPSEVDRLRLALERVASGKVDAKNLLQHRPKPMTPKRSHVRANISFDNDASETSTLVNIVAKDRPALLYDLAFAVSSTGCNIELVLLSTEAHKAIDVFYVTSGGKKLDPGHIARLRESLLAVCS